MHQELYAISNFNFISIYIIRKTALLLKNHLNYCKYSIFKRFFIRGMIDVFLFFGIIFFTIYNDEKFELEQDFFRKNGKLYS